MKNIEIFDMTSFDLKQIENILYSDFDNFWTPQILETELNGENKKYIVAKIDNEIVGFAGCMINFSEMEIMNIVVKKSERKKGIGTIMLNKIIEIAKNNDIEKIFLEVNEKNIPAFKIYQTTGFEEIGRRKKYYNNVDDAIIMSKKINNL